MFNNFFKDYADVCKSGIQFYKKHWLGSIIVTTGIFAAEFLPIYIKQKKEEKEFAEYLKKMQGSKEEEA